MVAPACLPGQVDEDQLPLGAALHAAVAVRYLLLEGARGGKGPPPAAPTEGHQDL